MQAEQIEIANNVADYFLAAALIPTFLLAVSYSFREPRIKGTVGTSFVLVVWALLLIEIIVVLSLFLGPEYPYRWLLRDIGYGALFVFMTIIYIVYEIERRSSVPVIDAWRARQRARVRAWWARFRAARSRRAKGNPRG